MSSVALGQRLVDRQRREEERVARLIIGRMPDGFDVVMFSFVDDQPASAQREVMVKHTIDLVRTRDDRQAAQLNRAIADRTPSR